MLEKETRVRIQKVFHWRDSDYDELDYYSRTGEIEVFRATMLGGRDFVSFGESIRDAKNQIVVLMGEEDGDLKDFIWSGRWTTCQPGHTVDVITCTMDRENRKGDKYKSRRIIYAQKVPGKKAGSERITWSDLTQLKSNKAVAKLFGNPYPVMAIHGEIRGVFKRRRWPNDREKLQKSKVPSHWEFHNIGDPTCTLVLWADEELAYCHFGPYRNAQPYIRIEGWNFKQAPTIEDLDLNLRGATVGVIGSTGGKVHHINATALFDLEAP